MSVPALPEVEVGEIAYDSYVNIISMIVPAAVVVYEHAITFHQEIELVWDRRINHITLLFYFNRFVALGYAASTLGNIPYGGSYHLFYARSKVASATWLIFLLLFTVTWAAFSAFRVYVVGKKALRLALCVFLLNMMNIVMNVRLLIIEISTSTFPASYGNGLGSFLHCNGSQSVSIDVTLAARACNIMADLIVLGVTWQATYDLKRTAHQMGFTVRYATLLLLDGTLYFVVLLLLNIVAITTNVLTVSLSTPYFVYGFQSVVISRFQLNLRQARHEPGEEYNMSIEISRTQDTRIDNAIRGVGGMGALLERGSVRFARAENIVGSPVSSRVELESVIDIGGPTLEQRADQPLCEDEQVVIRTYTVDKGSDAGGADRV